MLHQGKDKNMNKLRNAEGYRVRRAGVTVCLALSILFVAFTPLVHAQQNEVARAEQLMREGKPADAYALLTPLEDKYAGDVQFDYALGVAALDSGKADRATLAFERVLAVNPNYAGARLDMARAYFQLGDAERAKTEFLAVQASRPPAEAAAVITRYLDAIDQIERAKRRTLRAYVEGTIGYDDNVNNSGTVGEVSVPALGGLVFALNPSNLKRGDSYKSAAAGADFSYQFQPNFGVYAGADVRRRENTHQDNFDSGSMDLRSGLILGEQANQVRFGVTGGRYSLDNQLSRRTEGVTGEWRYTIDPANQVNAFGQYSRNRFTGAAMVNSFNQAITGAGYLRVLNEGKAAVFGAAFVGKERDVEGRADGAKRFYGFRLGGQLTLRDDVDLFGVLSSQMADYGRANGAFLTSRDDEQTDIVFGLNWRFAKDWTLKPQLLHSRNDSNITIYRYERSELSFTVRRDFN